MTLTSTRILSRILMASLLLASFAAWNALGLDVLNTEGFTKKMPLTFSGCGVAEPNALANFPALVVFDPSAQPTFDYNDFSPDASDLRFAGADGVELPYEIDTWNPAGRSLVWVRVSSLHDAARIDAYWGGAAAAPAYTGADNVWANGYVAVWHFSGSAVPLADSSSHGNALATLEGSVALGAGAAGGGIGNVADFGGGRSCLVAADSPVLDGMPKLTVELLACSRNVPDAVYGLVSKRTANKDQAAFTLFANGANINIDIGDSDNRSIPGGIPSKTAWHQLTMVFDGALPIANRVRYYEDARAFTFAPDSTTPASVPATTSSLHIGLLDLAKDETRGWNGYIDEVRISNVARSAGWIAANCASISAPLDFAAYGAVEDFNPEMPVVATLSAQVGAAGAVVSGKLISASAASAATVIHWDFEDRGDDAALWANSRTNSTPLTDGAPLSETLAAGADLRFARTYFARYSAFNAAADGWSPVPVSFTTLGAAVLGEPGASSTADSVTLNVELVDTGATNSVRVECLMGTSPDNMEPIKTWDVEGEQSLSWTTGGLALGDTFFYTFTARSVMPDDDSNIQTVFSATNAVSTFGASTWTNSAAGDWNTAANWDNGVPGPAAQANFYMPGATITALSGLVVSQAMANAAGLVTFDLGGSALTVADRFDIGGNPVGAYSADGGSEVRLASGEFDLSAATLTLGSTRGTSAAQNSARNRLAVESGATLRAKHIRIGLDSPNPSAYAPTNNMLSVVGPGAALFSETITVGVNSRSDANLLLVQNAALTNASTMTIGLASSISRTQAIFRNSSVHNKGNVYFAQSNWDSNSSFIIDEGTVFDVDGGMELSCSESQNNRLIVENATLNVAKLIRISNNGACAGFRFIIRGPGAVVNANSAADSLILDNGSDALVIVDRSALNMNGICQIGTWNGRGHGVIISNGVMKASSVRFSTGDSTPRGNFVEISGPDAVLTVGSIMAGNEKRISRDNFVHLNGGRLAASGAITLGAENCSSNNLIISAPTSKFTGATLNFFNNGRLIYNIPEEGFTNGIGGDSVATLTGALSLDATSSIEINAGKFIGRARLLQSAVALPDLAGKVAVNIARGSSYRIITPPDNTYLEINCTRDGTIIVVR